jgi:hypothetical protein
VRCSLSLLRLGLLCLAGFALWARAPPPPLLLPLPPCAQRFFGAPPVPPAEAEALRRGLRLAGLRPLAWLLLPAGGAGGAGSSSLPCPSSRVSGGGGGSAETCAAPRRRRSQYALGAGGRGSPRGPPPPRAIYGREPEDKQGLPDLMRWAASLAAALPTATATATAGAGKVLFAADSLARSLTDSLTH